MKLYPHIWAIATTALLAGGPILIIWLAGGSLH
jgi:hypothetical protein